MGMATAEIEERLADDRRRNIITKPRPRTNHDRPEREDDRDKPGR